MKRILPILILLGIAAGALAVNPYMMVLARKNAAGGCETVAQSFESFDGLVNTDLAKMGTKITASGNMTVCAVALHLGQPTGSESTLTLEIWSHDAGNDRPLTKLATSTGTPLGTPAVSADWFRTDLVSPVELTSSTTYWVCYNRSAGSGAVTLSRGNTAPERILEASASDWSDAAILSTARGGGFRLLTE